MKISMHSDFMGDRPPMVGPLPAIIKAMPEDAVYLIRLNPDEDRDSIASALHVAAKLAEVTIQIRGNGRQLAMNRKDESSNGC